MQESTAALHSTAPSKPEKIRNFSWWNLITLVLALCVSAATFLMPLRYEAGFDSPDEDGAPITGTIFGERKLHHHKHHRSDRLDVEDTFVAVPVRTGTKRVHASLQIPSEGLLDASKRLGYLHADNKQLLQLLSVIVNHPPQPYPMRLLELNPQDGSMGLWAVVLRKLNKYASVHLLMTTSDPNSVRTPQMITRVKSMQSFNRWNSWGLHLLPVARPCMLGRDEASARGKKGEGPNMKFAWLSLQSPLGVRGAIQLEDEKSPGVGPAIRGNLGPVSTLRDRINPRNGYSLIVQDFSQDTTWVRSMLLLRDLVEDGMIRKRRESEANGDNKRRHRGEQYTDHFIMLLPHPRYSEDPSVNVTLQKVLKISASQPSIGGIGATPAQEGKAVVAPAVYLAAGWCLRCIQESTAFSHHGASGDAEYEVPRVRYDPDRHFEKLVSPECLHKAPTAHGLFCGLHVVTPSMDESEPWRQAASGPQKASGDDVRYLKKKIVEQYGADAAGEGSNPADGRSTSSDGGGSIMWTLLVYSTYAVALGTATVLILGLSKNFRRSRGR